MPGATSGGAFPYPLGTEPVRDGDNAIKALAEKIDTAEWEVFRVEAHNLTNGSWQPLGFTTTPVSRGGTALGAAAGGSGIATKLAGRYLVHAATTIIANSAGARRGISVSSGIPSGTVPQFMMPPTTNGALPLVFSTVITATANAEYTIYVFQDSGTTLTASNSRLTLYKLN